MSNTLYEQVAEQLRRQIQNGTYRYGERVPSVRRLSRQVDVSMATVIEAYRLLEDDGLIEARPQSGYYVRSSHPLPAEPAMSQPSGRPTQVNIITLAQQVLRSANAADIVQLGVATPHPDFLPVKTLNRIATAVLRRQAVDVTRYDFPPGRRELRVQIARRMAEAGCAVSPDEIIVTAGCQEALSLTLRAITKPGDTILIESPTFYGTLQTIEAMGLKVVEIPTHPRTGVSLDAIKLALEQWQISACVLTPNFSNPVGALMLDDTKKQLLKLLASFDVPLIEDDIYGELGFSSPRPKAVKSFDRKHQVFYCSSFSKTVAPGYRVGWVAPPPQFHAKIEHLKYVSTMACATLPELAMAGYLARGGYEHHLRQLRNLCAQHTQRMIEAVSRYFPSDTRVTQPTGGYVLWVELPEKVDALDLHRRALQRKISIAPGPLFSAKQKYRNYIRLSCALPWDNTLDRALFSLGQMVSESAT